MTRKPLFSTYSQGENRVTGSMIAVFERLDLAVLEQILGGALGESSLRVVSFDLLRPDGPGTVPDARIASRFKYVFEVKTAYEALRRAQLEGHLAQLDGSYGDERLFAVTPDPSEPEVVHAIGDERLRWIPFALLSAAIDTALEAEGVSGEQRFLLRELQLLFAEEGLLGREDTVVVAAAWAYPYYLTQSAYVCQPGRSFRNGLTHMGFYRKRRIEPHIPAILSRRDNVVFTRDEAARLRADSDPNLTRVAELIETGLDAGTHEDGSAYQVFLLTSPDSPDTLVLPEPIQHRADGRGSAWTMGQRYLRFEQLAAFPTTTAELIGEVDPA